MRALRPTLSLLSLAVGAVALLSCGSDSTGPQLGGVTTVSVSPKTDSVTIGGTTTLSVVAKGPDGADLTGRAVFWHSENPAIAVVSEEGAVTGIVAGTVRIAASVEGVADFATITVLPKAAASVTLSSRTLALTVGQGAQLTATVRDAEGGVLGGADVTWTSSNTGVASVSSTGLVRGVAPGSATITARSGAVSANATVTVSPVPANSVVVSPGEATRFVGETVQLTAMVTDANGDELSGRPVTWQSSASGVATVSGSGLVTAVAPGTATITATSDGKTGKSTITVRKVPVASVDMDPGNATLEIGQTIQIRATPRSADGDALEGRSVVWSSSATAVATVNQSGVVTARSSGSTLIRATSEGVTGTALVEVSVVPVASVQVTPDTATLLAGQSLQLQARTLDAGGDQLSGRTVTWSSDDDDVASVSSTGKVLALSAGQATITATSEGKSATARITVVAPVSSISVEPESTSVVVGNTVTLVATALDGAGDPLSGRPFTWASSNTAVATVNSAGVVTGVAPGTATISATSGGKTGSAKVVVAPVPVASVVVEPDQSNVVAGQTVQLSASPRDAAGNALTGRDVTWSTSDARLATVGGSGLVTGVEPGTVTITATSEGQSGTATVTVTSALEGSVIVTPTDTTLRVGEVVTLRGQVIGSDGQPVDDSSLKWDSDDKLVATVTDDGQVSARLPGTATITATNDGKGKGGGDHVGTARVTVILF